MNPPELFALFFIKNLRQDISTRLVLKAIGVTIAVGVVGVMLWFIVPWILQAISTWWSWLGNHF